MSASALVSSRSADSVQVIGRYAVHGVIASGGMGTIHLGRLVGGAGFSRVVAIKRMHDHFAKDQHFVDMFVAEAKLAARVRHACVVPMLDVVTSEDDVLLVMELIQGESLGKLWRLARAKRECIPFAIASAVLADLLRGLHAVHEATDERGNPLNIVHRDVSPQNVLVGEDGVARVIDFGVAKALGTTNATQPNNIKGKIGYLSPERLIGTTMSRATDIYAAGVVAWELLTGERLFTGTEPQVLHSILHRDIRRPSEARAGIPKAFDDFVMRAVAKNPEERFESALEMAIALERLIPPASRSEVTAFVRGYAAEALAYRAKLIADIESGRPHVIAKRPSDPPEPASQTGVIKKKRKRVVLGLVLPQVKDLIGYTDDIVQYLASQTGLSGESRIAHTYEDLTRDFAAGRINVAWLPPLVYLRLGDTAKNLGWMMRDGEISYESVLITRRRSRINSIADLRGTRAGWIDPWSASGFVIPRVGLVQRGVDPRALFRTEHFYGSHRAAMEALREGACDVVGTYARGSKGAWEDVPDLDVDLLAKFGKIPPDVIAAHQDVEPAMQARIAKALSTACSGDLRPAMTAVFGGADFKAGVATGYQELTTAMGLAKLRGLFD